MSELPSYSALAGAGVAAIYGLMSRRAESVASTTYEVTWQRDQALLEATDDALGDAARGLTGAEARKPQRRVRLLWALIDQEMAVNELAQRLGKPAPSVSQHLAKLRMARLVRTRREGTQVFYRLENEHVARLVRDAVYNAEHAGPELPSHHVDERRGT